MSNRVPREKAVFIEALEIVDSAQRSKFLDGACGADRALREEVDKLLAFSQSAGDFFKDCAPALEPDAADAARVLSAAESALEPELPETKSIGPYKLLKKLNLNPNNDSENWFDWVFARVLLHEASELLAARRGPEDGGPP